MSSRAEDVVPAKSARSSCKNEGFGRRLSKYSNTAIKDMKETNKLEK